MARKKKKAHHEEHISEAWLIPYADILTLLLALFIVLYASSKVDQKKFEQIAQSFSMAFNSGQPALLQSQSNQPDVQMDVKKSDKAYLQETTQLMDVKNKIDKYISENKLEDSLKTDLTEDGLLIRIKEKALYPSGSANLLPESLSLGTQIAKILEGISQKVIVSGHSDNVPINTFEFPTNWDLSSKRSVNFMRYLLSQANLDPAKFSATAYGQYQPLVANTTEEGRAQNRRVEVLISRSFKQNNIQSIM